MKRSVVAVVCREETTVGDALPRLGEGAKAALGEGRLFIGARRASQPSDTVLAGEELLMYPPRDEAEEAPRILHARGGIVAAYKPAAMPTIADQRGVAGTLQQEVAVAIGIEAGELHATSRLDVGVSGVVLFAADEPARSMLALARREGRYRRHYVAVASGALPAPRGEWTGRIGRDRDPRRRRVNGRDAVRAETAYVVAASTARAHLLSIEPRTGRTHQIRVHAAHAGCPLWGDAGYRGPTRITSESGAVRQLTRIALHAAWVEVSTATSETIRFEAAVPDDLAAIWETMGGDPTAWNVAWEAIDDR